MSTDAELRALRAAGDAAGMIAWLTDPDRVDRVLAATGDYATVLAALRAVHEQVRDRRPPDLVAGLKLAFARERICCRLEAIAAEVPAAWARLGDAARAQALAHSLPDPAKRAQAVELLAQVTADAGRAPPPAGEPAAAGPAAGELAAAEAKARRIDHPAARARELAAVAGRWAGAGAVRRGRLVAVEAETGAQAGRCASRQESDLYSLAEAWAEAGELDRAEAAARSATRPSVWTILRLVRKAAEAGDPSRARRLTGEIEAIARAETIPLDRERALEAWVTALIAVGDLDRAGTVAADLKHPTGRASALDQVARALAEAGLVKQAASAAGAISHRGEQNRTRTALAEISAAAGDRAAAEDLLRGIVPRHERVGGAGAVAAGWAAAGDLERALLVIGGAETAARSAETPEERALALTALVRPLARIGQLDRARLVADEAEAAARPAQRPLAALAHALTEIGELERAESIARSLDSVYWRELPLSGVARAWAVAGEFDRAVAVAAANDTPKARARALTLLAGTVAEAGDPAAARRMAGEAEAAARSAAEPGDRAEALAGLASALVSIGELDRAEAMLSAGYPDRSAGAWRRLAVARARSGEPDRARSIARTIPAGPGWSAMIEELAGVCGPAWPAELVAAALLDTPARDLFKTLVRIEPEALIPFTPQ